ncbi:unnamed protein product [Nesidiocoris tenuis]|uniref:Ionotropic glutamate receptor C-terminal domain-containing protein n=1 Tax=Nesidiocoris tenuis TaxID=355587 RepID=A0A6H5G6N0_9HEMI|nr:unnamed protein product [Nesidiocoris tenuis]
MLFLLNPIRRISLCCSSTDLGRWDLFKTLSLRDRLTLKAFCVFRNFNCTAAFLFNDDDEVFGISSDSCFDVTLLGLDQDEKSIVTPMNPFKIDRLSGLGLTYVSVGVTVGAALDSEGQMYWWGKTSSLLLQPATGSVEEQKNAARLPQLAVTNLHPAPKFKQVSCGHSLVAGLTDAGKVYVWGRLICSIFECEELVTNSPVDFLSCGGVHMAMLSDGKVYTWGVGFDGQRGPFSRSDLLIVKQVVLPGPCVSVVCGPVSTVMLLESGDVYVCGANNEELGFLGVDCSEPKLTKPMQLQLGGKITEIAVTWVPKKPYVAYAATDENGDTYFWGTEPVPAQRFTDGNDTHSIIEAFQNLATPRNIGMNLFVLLAASAASAALQMSSKFPANLFDATYSIIRTYLPDECTCFIYDPDIPSEMLDQLLQTVGEQRPLNIVKPVEESPFLDIFFKLPVKPYPCSYVLVLKTAESKLPWSLNRGSYVRGDYPMESAHFIIVAEEQLALEEINSILNEIFTYGILSANLINPENDQVSVYTLFPFGMSLDRCPAQRTTADLIGVWRNFSWTMFHPMFARKIPAKTFSGCPLNISCTWFPPYIIVPDEGRYTGEMKGFEGGPLTLLFQRLNLTPEWNIHGKNSWVSTSEDNKTVAGSIPDLLFGRGAQMSCGGVGPLWATGPSHFTMFFSWANTAWYVAAPNKVPKWTMLYAAFPNILWLLVIISGLLMPVCYWVLSKMAQSKTGSFSRDIFLLLALILSNSAGQPPKRWSLRIAFLSWLIYTFHVDQTYIASLTGLIISAEYEPMIKTVDQLLEAGLPTKAYFFTRESIKNSETRWIRQLINNSVDIENNDFQNALVEMSRFKNVTIVDNKVFVKYVVSDLSGVSIYPTDVEIEETMFMNAIMMRHHYLLPRINWILLRMYDAGYPVFFLRHTVADRFWKLSNNFSARALTTNDLTGPFYLLAIGLTLSIFVFLMEHMCAKVGKSEKGL